ncbi:unnamed protein product [Cercospora beticola]|nr:unnamed protein product [Cercospora beticola]
MERLMIDLPRNFVVVLQQDSKAWCLLTGTVLWLSYMMEHVQVDKIEQARTRTYVAIGRNDGLFANRACIAVEVCKPVSSSRHWHFNSKQYLALMECKTVEGI